MQLAGDRTFHQRSYPPVPAQPSSESEPFLSLNERADEWDLQNQAAMRQLEQTQPNSQELYDRFMQMREVERKQMEIRNLVDNPDTRRALDDAIIFVGSCHEMCPVYERVRREFQRNVKNFECLNGKIAPQLAIKAFSRPAAGQPPALPSDVRPPSVLVKTLGYLLENIVPALPDSHPFLWDRTRSIRQDFTYQNYAGPEALECIQIIARIHILCLHVMIGNSDWSQQQEREQLIKSLRTLDEQYALRPNRTLSECPHEPEIHAYQLLVHIFDAETAYKVESLPRYIVDHPLLQLALRLRALVAPTQYQPSQFYAFFKLLREPTTPLLFQIICETHFPTIRSNFMGALNRSLHKSKKAYDLGRFATLMGFDDSSEATEYLSRTKVKIADGKVLLDTWTDEKFEPAKSRFIDRRLDFSVLSGPSPQNLAAPAPRQKSFYDPNAIPTNSAPARAPVPTVSATPSTIPSAALSTAPLAKPSPTVAPAPPPPKPSQKDIALFANQQLAESAKELVREAAAAATASVKRSRDEQRAQQDRYVKALKTQLVEDILRSIAHETSLLASRAIFIRQRSLAKTLVTATHHCAQAAIPILQRKNEAKDTANEFLATLRNNSAPRLAERPRMLPAPEATAPEPAAPKVYASPVEVQEIRDALLTAAERGAKVVAVMADWSTELGARIKALFALGPDYSHTLPGGLLVATDTEDNPDVSLNFLNHRLPGFISAQPARSFVARITAQLTEYRPVLSPPPPPPQGMSIDDTAELSLFLPSKRSFTSWVDEGPDESSSTLFTPKRFSMPRPPINRALSGVHELQKLLQESKKLID